MTTAEARPASAWKVQATRWEKLLRALLVDVRNVQQDIRCLPINEHHPLVQQALRRLVRCEAQHDRVHQELMEFLDAPPEVGT